MFLTLLPKAHKIFTIVNILSIFYQSKQVATTGKIKLLCAALELKSYELHFIKIKEDL